MLDTIYNNQTINELEDALTEFSTSTELNRDVHPLFFLPGEFRQLYNQFNAGKTPEQRVNAKKILAKKIHGDPNYYSTESGEQDLVEDNQYLNTKYEEKLPEIVETHGGRIKDTGFAYYEEDLNQLYQEVDGIENEEEKTIKQAELEGKFSSKLIQLLISIDPNDERIKAIKNAQGLLQDNGDPSALGEIVKDMYGENHAGYFMNQIGRNPEHLNSTVQMYTRIKQKEIVDSYRNDNDRIDITKIKDHLVPKLGENPKGYEGLVREIYSRAHPQTEE